MSRAIKPDARNTWLWVRSVYTIRCRSETAQKQVSIRQLSSGPGFCGGAAAGRKQLSVYIQSCTMCIPYPILCICSEAYTMTSMPVLLERPLQFHWTLALINVWLDFVFFRCSHNSKLLTFDVILTRRELLPTFVRSAHNSMLTFAHILDMSIKCINRYIGEVYSVYDRYNRRTNLSNIIFFISPSRLFYIRIEQDGDNWILFIVCYAVYMPCSLSFASMISFNLLVHVLLPRQMRNPSTSKAHNQRLSLCSMQEHKSDK